MTPPADSEYTVQIWKEGDQFIAHAMPLDIMSSGPTIDAAREALDEAVSLFLETAAEVGTLEEAKEPPRKLPGVVSELAGVAKNADTGEPGSEYAEYLLKKYS